MFLSSYISLLNNMHWLDSEMKESPYSGIVVRYRKLLQNRKDYMLRLSSSNRIIKVNVLRSCFITWALLYLLCHTLIIPELKVPRTVFIITAVQICCSGKPAGAFTGLVLQPYLDSI
jgi:hypothetical protein